MPVPDFQSLCLPMLRVMSDGKEYPMTELRARVAECLKLSPEDLAERLPSGVQTVFANRIAWSSVYLHKAGALSRPRRGVFQITERGRELLALNLPRLTIRELSRYPEFVSFHKGDNGARQESSPAGEATLTPEEQLESAYRVLRDNLAAELLETVKKSPPGFFERLVIELLVSMGYGGSEEDAAKVVGGPRDEGIDGVIKEDKLGLDAAYVQAKRWKEGHRARKGALISTSHFTPDAHAYLEKIGKRIVLIDGKRLADLMIEHDVGVKTKRAYVLKKLDSDFFESAGE
ncbi:MAG: winged helix-turn-helix domain-containing protein [Bryobacteraceae bacterium]